MFGIEKVLTLLLRLIHLKYLQSITFRRLKKLLEDFQENILGEVILVYDCYSEQSVCKLTKRSALTPKFSGEVFKNAWLWMAASGQCKIAACTVIRILL